MESQVITYIDAYQQLIHIDNGHDRRGSPPQSWQWLVDADYVTSEGGNVGFVL